MPQKGPSGHSMIALHRCLRRLEVQYLLLSLSAAEPDEIPKTSAPLDLKSGARFSKAQTSFVHPGVLSAG